MNNIGIGIFCFGDEHYFNFTKEKLDKFIEKEFKCYVLTDNPEFFKEYEQSINVILYDKENKSYHDKMLLPKYILKEQQIAIIIDADSYITDYSIIDDFRQYIFNVGISYVDTLLNHPARLVYNSNINYDELEWKHYKKFIDENYESVLNFETIWEYLIIVNRTGFNSDEFYEKYNEIQDVREKSDLISGKNKKIIGNGEGISLRYASILSDTLLQRDFDLYEIIKDKIINVSKNFTHPNFLPNFMK